MMAMALLSVRLALLLPKAMEPIHMSETVTVKNKGSMDSLAYVPLEKYHEHVASHTDWAFSCEQNVGCMFEEQA